jgi:hypothetical protein
MKTILLAAAALLFMNTALAQVQYSVFAGPQFTTAHYKVQGVKQETTYKPGLLVGAGMKVPFENHLYFSPSVFYSLKGYKVKFKNFAFPPDATATDNNTSIHTFELAAMLQYDFNDQPSHFMVRVGPSLDFQLFGQEHFNTPMEEVERDMPFGFDKYGHYSTNMIFQFGYEMKNGFFVLGQYSYGLTSISNTDNGPDIRHRVFGITIGTFFNSKKIVMDTSNMTK